MKNYKIVLINKKINGNIRSIYEERDGAYYRRMKGEIPLELRKISITNEPLVRDFRLNKLELKIQVD